MADARNAKPAKDDPVPETEAREILEQAAREQAARLAAGQKPTDLASLLNPEGLNMLGLALLEGADSIMRSTAPQWELGSVLAILWAVHNQENAAALELVARNPSRVFREAGDLARTIRTDQMTEAMARADQVMASLPGAAATVTSIEFTPSGPMDPEGVLVTLEPGATVTVNGAGVWQNTTKARLTVRQRVEGGAPPGEVEPGAETTPAS